jgi:hypothetical protein
VTPALPYLVREREIPHRVGHRWVTRSYRWAVYVGGVRRGSAKQKRDAEALMLRFVGLCHACRRRGDHADGCVVRTHGLACSQKPQVALGSRVKRCKGGIAQSAILQSAPKTTCFPKSSRSLGC